MAFATTNVKTVSAGNLRWLVGRWTGVVGDAAGTLTLKGGAVYQALFSNQDSTSNEDRPTPVDVSVSGGTITITVYNHHTVTNGRFIIAYE